MKLYGYFRSSAAFRVRIALNLKKLSYESAFIHLRRGDQRQPGFLEINPQGLVPALEIDDTLLIQSLPIIEYLDETYPEPPLLPSDAKGRARVRALAAIVACDVHPINNLRVSATCFDRLAMTKRPSRRGTIIGSPRGSALWNGSWPETAEQAGSVTATRPDWPISCSCRRCSMRTDIRAWT